MATVVEYSNKVPSYVLQADYKLANYGGTDPESLPPGFPTHVSSQSSWSGDEVQRVADQWIMKLSTNEVHDITLAVAKFIDSDRELQELSKETFAISNPLSERLAKISEACYDGLGFCVLRGLPTTVASDLEKAVLFGGIAAHVAPERGFQDVDRQHVLAHLFKRYQKTSGEYIPPSFDNKELSFHTDDGDLVALYYPCFTDHGGKTQLASHAKMYNKLAQIRPDVLRELSKDWIIDRYYRPHDPPRRVPLLHRHGSTGITFQHTRLPFSRYMGSRAPRNDIPDLSPVQNDALNALQAVAQEFSFPVPTETGDMLFFNNISLSHGREPYNESRSMEVSPIHSDRHVMRLWLRDPARTTLMTSPVLRATWDEIYGKAPGDSKRREIWNITPVSAFAMNADKNG